jgi:hypothetical protein
MPATATQKKTLLPFRPNTRQRVQPIQRVPFTLSQRVSVEIPRVGFIAGIFLNCRMTPTFSEGSPAFTVRGIWDVLKRIQVTLNIGTASLWDTTGLGAFCFNRDMMSRTFDPTAPGLIYNALDGNSDWRWSYFIPLALNDGLQFNTGLINLQAPEIRCTIDLSFLSTYTDVCSLLTALSGYVDVSYLYYEVPNPNSVMYPPMALHRVLEQRDTISAVGDVVYTVPRQGTLLQLAHIITLNGVHEHPAQENGQHITGMRLVVNKTDDICRFLPDVQNYWNAMRKGAPCGTNFTGIPMAWLYDFLSATGDRGSGDTRDTIDSEACSTLESILTVDSGATVGLAFVDSIRRVVQLLQL